MLVPEWWTEQGSVPLLAGLRAAARACVEQPAAPLQPARVCMPSDWYVVVDGKPSGPMDDSHLKALVREGRITPETLISRAGMQKWVPAQKIKGLFGAAPSTTTLPQAVRPQSPSPPTPALRRPVAPQIEAPSAPVVQISTRPSRSRYVAKPDFSLNIMLGLGGAAALLLGFFCPIMRLPIIGSMSHLSFIGLLVREGAVSEMTISAVLVLAAVGVAVIAAAIKQPPLFWIPGICGACATLLTVGKYLWMQGEMARNMKKDLDGNPFAGLAQAMVQAVSLDFGIGVIVIGAGLFIAAAVVTSTKRV
jgi:hypothetical protein